ncbi:MAG TPA: Hsp20/alpha crystallin family protein [Thermoanaerobaculia bacterium]|jgi:HSP20 family protein|nr:Hsp20/alpha crystallin family protein [Thermoanaerobaculia bacterium]
MATFRWNSMQELMAIQEKMNRLFEEVLYRREFPEGSDERAASRWAPAADAFESAREYVFRVEIPGVSLSDVKLEVEDGKLRLCGTRPEVDPASRFLRMERVYGDFDREFEIPHDIDAERISASLSSGILTIRAPKKGTPAAEEP